MKGSVISKRIFIFLSLVLFTIFVVAISVVFVVSSGDIDPRDSNVDSNVSENSDSASSLTSSEVDEILGNITINEDLDGVISQMNDLINRAILTGNDDLKQYAEYVKQKCELKKQMNSLDESISALKAKNADVASVDATISSSSSANINTDNIQGIVSGDGLELLKSVDLGKVTEGIVDVPGLSAVLNNPDAATSSQKALVEIILLQSAIDKGLFKDDQIDSAKISINTDVSRLVSDETSKYSGDEYESLTNVSREFELQGNKAGSIPPSNIVLYNNPMKLSDAPIVYDSNILISINDVIRLTGASVQYTDGTSNITLSKNKKFVEISKGSNVAYVDDECTTTTVPVLTFKGITYIPVEFSAKSFDIPYVWVPDNNVFAIYSNAI